MKLQKYYFNWNKILIDSKRQHELIIILTYASYIGYNRLMSNSKGHLLSLLKIDNLPRDINKFVKQNKKSKPYNLFSIYKVNEPQSFFVNQGFMFSDAKPIFRVQYLWLLSMRSIDTSNNFIPIEYLNDKEINSIKHNPFIEVKHNRITFTLEQNMFKNQYKTITQGELN